MLIVLMERMGSGGCGECEFCIVSLRSSGCGLRDGFRCFLVDELGSTARVYRSAECVLLPLPL